MEFLKCVVHTVKQASAVLAAGNPVSNIISVPIAVVFYWGATMAFDFYSFGIDQLNYSISLDSYSLSFYYLINATFPAIAIFIIILAPSKRVIPQNIAAIMLVFLILDNLVMALDAALFIRDSYYLSMFDEIIQGDPESLIPFGLSDVILTGDSYFCVYLYVYQSRC